MPTLINLTKSLSSNNPTDQYYSILNVNMTLEMSTSILEFKHLWIKKKQFNAILEDNLINDYNRN